MKDVFLFPQKFKVVGIIFSVPALVFAIYVLVSEFEFSFLDWVVPWSWIDDGTVRANVAKDNFTNELAMLSLLVFLCLFQKQNKKMSMYRRLDMIL